MGSGVAPKKKTKGMPRKKNNELGEKKLKKKRPKENKNY